MNTPVASQRHSNIARLAQSLPNNIRWAFADSALLQAIENNEALVRGARGLVLAKLITISKNMSLEWLAIQLIGYLEAMTMYAQYRSSPKYPCGNAPARLFIGFGAGMEDELFRIFADQASAVLRLNQQDLANFNRISTIPLFVLFRRVRDALRQVKNHWSLLPPELNDYSVEFLTHCAMRLARYSFFRAWFEAYMKELNQVPEVCLVSPDALAFAAVDAEVVSVFFSTD